MRSVVLALAAFAAMEPITALVHRFVMHGVGMGLHRSHHRRGARGWELNDAFPLAFASVVCTGMWVGFHVPAWSDLIPLGVGVTAYGAAYAAVHDVHTHARLGRLGTAPVPLLDRLAADHGLHHRYGGAPYGMLVPLVPRRTRARSGLERVTPVPRT